jgi:phage N-6-adenine-methyltransferase
VKTTTSPGASPALFMSEKEDWETPPEFFRLLDDEFSFDLDVAANAENAKCENYFTEEVDAFRRHWLCDSAAWLNPPYGRDIGKWIHKAHRSAIDEFAPVVVCLVPARTDTVWWHEFAMRADEIRFVKGRLKFVGAPSSAPFPSAILIFRSDPTRGPKMTTMGKAKS